MSYVILRHLTLNYRGSETYDDVNGHHSNYVILIGVVAIFSLIGYHSRECARLTLLYKIIHNLTI